MKDQVVINWNLVYPLINNYKILWFFSNIGTEVVDTENREPILEVPVKELKKFCTDPSLETMHRNNIIVLATTELDEQYDDEVHRWGEVSTSWTCLMVGLQSTSAICGPPSTHGL